MQKITSCLRYPPVLMVDNVSKAFEEGHRRVGVEQSAFELTPVTTMQVLGDKYAAFLYAREIQGKRLGYVARQMRAIINDDVELR